MENQSDYTMVKGKADVSMQIIRSILEEAVRIKMKVTQSRSERPLKSLVLTSADHGEGVTSVAAGLALAFALQEGVKVLLVDANIRNPGIHRLFGIDLSNGLIDFISGRADMLTFVKDTACPQLNVISAGQLQTENTLALLSALSPDIKKAIEKDFDWVVYDMAPVNVSPETLMGASLADGVILVIRAEKTRWQSVKKAKDSLESVNAHILGAVLNSQEDYIPRFIHERF